MTHDSGQPQSHVSVRNFGHSTQLIGVNGRYVLTDPHFGRRCTLWPRRSPMPDPAQLPPLDAVVISHAHPDHLHIGSFKYIPSTVPIFVPEGMAGALRYAVQNPIIALNWWTRFTLPNGLSMTAVPARHFGGRWLPWRFRTVCGFLITAANTTVYFAGDTRMGTHFREIGHTVSVDVALLPISAMAPVPWMTQVHLTPRQAAEATADLQPKTVIPIHWGTFGWSATPNAKDVDIFKASLLMQGLGDRCVVLPPGQEWCSNPQN
jgi:L-ascorbate metabolism protein UlaG (beta-lactamase superfamily)